MLVHADRVETVLFVELHLAQMIRVELLATHRVEERVRIRIERRLLEVGPRQQVESVDFHRTLLGAPRDDRQAGMISRPNASSVAAMPGPIMSGSTCVTPAFSSRSMARATSSAVPARTKWRARSSLT